MPTFHDQCALEAQGDGCARAHIDPSWAQGRATFGGVVGALGLRALQRVVPPDRAPRSALVSFVGPIAPGAVDVRTEILRAGGSLTHGQARLVQDGQVMGVVQAAFGATRPTRIVLPSPPAPIVSGPEDARPFPYLPGITPAFTQHFEHRWTVASLPFTGGTTPHVQGWVRLREPGAMDAATVLALLDSWPPPVWSVFDRPAPGSSVSWQVNWMADVRSAPRDAWWLYEARTTSAADGYTDFEARLWDAQGRAVAHSRQLFAEFSGRAAR
jgi:acyl-CoA thioesterase